MKKIIWITLLLTSSLSWANCVDLSHKSKIGESDLEIKQIGCTQFKRQMFFEGQPYGESVIFDLDGNWKLDSVDDEYETYTRQIRWNWNADSSILVYDFIVDTFEKGPKLKSLVSGAQVYKKTTEGKIEFTQYTQTQLMQADGTVSVLHKQKTELREPLN